MANQQLAHQTNTAERFILASIVNAGLRHMIPALRNGDLDMIVSGIPDSPYKDLVQGQLHDDEFAVFASANHPLSSRAKVTIVDLAQARWATTAISSLQWQWLQRSFENHGLPRPRAALETGAFSLTAVLTASSDLLWFTVKRRFQESVGHLPLVEIPVKELKWIRHVGVSYRRSAFLSPVARLKIRAAAVRARSRRKETDRHGS